MMINPDKIVTYYDFFPEMPANSTELSEIENKVKKYIEDLQEKGGYCWKKTTSIVNSLGTLYRIAWLPYTMLKSPCAYQMKMSPTSAEKNVEILANVTAENVKSSVMTSSVRRAVPWMSLSAERASSLSGWIGNMALLSPLVYAPGIRTFNCISHGSGVNSMDIHQIQLDIGNCIDQSSRIYQGPEAVVGLVTSLALGAVAQFVVSFALWMLLKDGELSYRYNTLERIYCDVAMNLKNRWDVAVLENNESEMESLKTTALKISNGMELIAGALQIHAWLTTEQVSDLKEKLTWSCRYITQETGMVKP